MERQAEELRQRQLDQALRQVEGGANPEVLSDFPHGIATSLFEMKRNGSVLSKLKEETNNQNQTGTSEPKGGKHKKTVALPKKAGALHDTFKKALNSGWLPSDLEKAEKKKTGWGQVKKKSGIRATSKSAMVVGRVEAATYFVKKEHPLIERKRAEELACAQRLVAVITSFRERLLCRKQIFIEETDAATTVQGGILTAMYKPVLRRIQKALEADAIARLQVLFIICIMPSHGALVS